MQRTIQLCVLVALAAMWAQAASITVFSNFNSNPANLYDGSDAYPVSGQPPQAWAMGFTPSSTYVLTQIDVAIGLGSGTSSVDVAVYSDSGGSPGSALTSWTVSSLPEAFSCCAVVTLIPGTSITLNAGTPYWVLASASSDTWAFWQLNNLGEQGPVWFNNANFVSWEGAFDVLGTAVPEPASALLAAFGVVLLGMAVHRRQRRV